MKLSPASSPFRAAREAGLVTDEARQMSAVAVSPVLRAWSYPAVTMTLSEAANRTALTALWGPGGKCEWVSGSERADARLSSLIFWQSYAVGNNDAVACWAAC